jgi:hypothetical protein
MPSICREQIGVFRNKVAHARGRPSGYRFEIVRDAIVSVGRMQASHGEEMFEDMLR